MIKHSQRHYGRTSGNRIDGIREPGITGARLLVESFYYAFNHRDLIVLKQVWAEHDLIQLNNPLGGILRGYEPIAALYSRVFSGTASVWVELDDIVEFETENMIVFAGREYGEFALNNQTLALAIRTSRIVQWFGADVGWRQIHHHGSIDDPKLLEAYQQAVQAG
ncbi:MAG: nuclear transport factor 2 family protein [Methyloglobulus sp.]|nr:SnoaL-like domain-containing protein [Methyloglobulus sp.]